MKRVSSLTVLLLLLVTSFSSFAANVVVDGREWRQVDESIFTNKSWNELATSCNPTTGTCADGTGYEGLTWASRSEVQAMWDALAGSTGLGDTKRFEANSAWAPLIVGTSGPFLPTVQAGTYVAVYGWARDQSAGQGRITYVLDAASSLANDAANGFDFSTSEAQAHWGAWMYITPVPEPESYALLLTGLGFVGFVARRRRQQGSA